MMNKRGKNNAKWWKIENQQWKMMKKREATMKNDEHKGKNKKMTKNSGKPMKHDEI